MRFVYVIPTGSFLLALALIGFSSNLGDYDPEPEKVVLYTNEDYQDKAKAYANRENRQEALDTCEAMPVEDEYDESDQDICFLRVHKVLDDVNGQIEIFEKWHAQELADDDSGVGTKHTLKGLYEERDKRK